ncbi:MAG TPA: methylmalonyl-CoA mutase family protein [Candidatus Eisenbacteria bacterium]|nr:methylmalonyl-CoA mutase family protein [Candidatus Eisenbacteria bacterium]
MSPRERQTSSGIPLEPVYGPADAPGPYLEKLGFPGAFPYTRGVHPTMYRGQLWTMRQYAGFGSARQTNERFRFLLEHGQTGLSVAFDLPTQMGLDSDHARARGEVGRVGVAISTVDDMAELMDGLPLDRVTTSMTINATAPILLSLYAAVAEERGIDIAKLGGTVQNDLLKEYIARGTYIYPPEGSLRLTTDLFAFCARSMPRWNPISISGYHMREAGATAAQELAFTLANGLTYVQAAVDRGLDVDEFAPRLSFFFNAHNDFLEEVAKFRAARRLWASLMRERFHPQSPKSLLLRFHVQTAGSTLTAQQPENNIVRTALQALAAVLGGAQSLHTNSFDEALGLPTEKAARIALRTQQVIAHESGVPSTIDPVGGAHFLEALTDDLEAKARDYLAEIDRRGGMLAAIETGFVQHEIHVAAYKHQMDVEAGRAVVVGVNQFVEDEPEPPKIFQPDARVEAERAERLRAFRAGRDPAAHERAMSALERGAKGDENLVALILSAVKARATLGEISDRLRAVFGVFQPAKTL